MSLYWLVTATNIETFQCTFQVQTGRMGYKPEESLAGQTNVTQSNWTSGFPEGQKFNSCISDLAQRMI